MAKVLGIDLGTNSIGLSVRNTEKGKDIVSQLDYFSSIVFESGVGHGKSGEFSYAAERTKHRSTRRLYQARKYRKWATLALLIEYGYCPLTMDELNRWRIYDKEKGFKREYPTGAVKFERWIRLDFDGDGVSDYSSPYALRAELMERQFDFSDETDRYKLGRAIYHIAQRRGFRSSKGETLKEQENAESADNSYAESVDFASELKKSEEKKSKDLVNYMKENNLPTAGCAFAKLEKEGIRVRNSIYKAVRAQYKEELTQIFAFQNGIDPNGDFCRRVLSEKKHEGTVFYKRPLRSQKGTIGHCTLEPDKPRCPVSHPDFEDFRAWCLINNIKYRRSPSEDWQTLSTGLKVEMLKDKFWRTKRSFKFEELRRWLEVKLAIGTLDYKLKTINYKDNTSVSGNPISGRLKNLLGDEWQTFQLETCKERVNTSTGSKHNVSYGYEDIWHICFSADEPEEVQRIAKEKMGFDDKQTRQMVSIWSDIQQGYAMLSLKAIRKILPFLHKGLIYSDAVMLAKVPDVLGAEIWKDNEDLILSSIKELDDKIDEQKMVFRIANTLISSYKSLDYQDQFAYKNTDYKLDDSDLCQVRQCLINDISIGKWNSFSKEKQSSIINQVAGCYQAFFSSNKRDYYRLPRQEDALKQFLSDNFDFLRCQNGSTGSSPCDCAACKKMRTLYHPSQIEFYAPAKEQLFEHNGVMLSKRLLETPTIGAIKNPVVLRTLHILRRQINNLLKEGIVDEETRVVVETARDFNDANMRWAIENYQKNREKERKEISKILIENYPQRSLSEDDVRKALLLIEQHDILDMNNSFNAGVSTKEKGKINLFQKDVTKYKLWLEQGCRCVYTGKMIGIANLFDDNAFDLEHTVPRSISFDDSLSNLTVCDSVFNRTEKKNQLPSELSNYSDILKRIQPWIEKVENLKERIDFWKAKSRQAATKESKDQAIRQRHLWEMELDYWESKVKTFTIKKEELTDGFRNRQLVDTRIITKYAFHYLKTVFGRVDVQKGAATAEFRKILGVQSVDETKCREKHSHHAIDATVLTLIPPSAKRVKMTQLFYEIQEAHRMNLDCTVKEQELHAEIGSCHLGNVSSLVPYIENNILINHITKDQTSTPAKRCIRQRGKVVLSKNGEKMWRTGDCIRGRLHEDSFLAKIKYPKCDQDGKPLRENGEYVYETGKDGNDVLRVVINVLTTDKFFEKEENLNNIVDAHVRDSIRICVKRIMEERQVTFQEAMKGPLWMVDKNEQPIRFDKNNRPLSPIRHVRCWLKAGRGFLTPDKAYDIKDQVYQSKHEYKNHFYAKNDTNYICLLYEYSNKEKIERAFRIINLFEYAQLGYKRADAVQKEKYFQSLKKGKKEFKLVSVLKVGMRVLMWEKNPTELSELSVKDLNSRLFQIFKFNYRGAEIVYLQNHMEARPDDKITEEGSYLDTTRYQSRLHLVANSFNCLIEGRDFYISDIGKIVLKTSNGNL